MVQSFDNDTQLDYQPGLMINGKNSDEANLGPTKEASVKCPQVVLSFCEEPLPLER